MRKNFWSWLMALAVVIGMIAAGCGGGGSDNSDAAANNNAFATIQVNHALARTVPANVDTFQFTGRDAGGATVFGPQDFAKSPQLNLTVPITLTNLTIDYFSNGTVVGTFSQSVALASGSVFVINDPNWTDTSSGGSSTTSSSSSSTSTSSSSGGTGLTHLNQLRSLATLPAIAEDANLTDGCTKHAIYMVKNNVIQHSEDPANQLFTPEGNTAAQNSNLSVSTALNNPLDVMIDGLMTSPFHGVGFIDPLLFSTGIGYFSENRGPGVIQTGAAINVLSSRAAQPLAPYPIVWPGNGQTVGLRSYDGNESPDPLTSLPGFTAPTGLPLYVLFDPASGPVNITAFSVIEVGGPPLTVGEFDGTNYTNPDPAQQDLGRNVLGQRNCVVLMPQSPLTAGKSYQCSVSNAATGTQVNWTFTVDANAPRQERPRSIVR